MADAADTSDTKGDLIAQLVGMDDEALASKLGFDDQVDAFKKNMARANKLSGPARDKVLASLSNMFTPQSYAIGDIGYQIDRAEAKANGKTSPQAIVDCCCGDGDM